MPYRAGHELSERITRLKAESRQLAARLTETYWALLEAEGPIHRDPTDVIAEVTRDGEDEPESTERALLRYKEHLESVIAGADERRRELVALPMTLPDETCRPPWPAAEGVSVAAADYVRLSPESRNSLLHDVAHCLGRLDAEAKLEHRLDTIFCAPVRLAGAPMALVVEPVALTGDVTITLTTPVRRALAPVRLERYTWVHTLTTAVRLHDDARVGDREFDDHFLVSASEPAARQLLDAELRAELLGLAHFATPCLDLASGLATLHFRYAFSSMLLERAAGVLTRVRARDIEVQLIRPAADRAS